MKRREAIRALTLGAAAGVVLPLTCYGDKPLLDGFGSLRQGAFEPDVELTLTAAPGEAGIFPGSATRVWRFTGSVTKGAPDSLQPIPNSYLGPTIRLRRGQKVRIRFRNQLPESSIVHWHGLDVPSAMDGHPHRAIASGREYIYEFQVVNRAGTYWYHPHPHQRTGWQINHGLAGVLIVSDDEEAALNLPNGAQEIICVLQDNIFDDRNQLVYLSGMMEQMHGFLGDDLLVNGQQRPSLSLPSRAHRIRLLNVSSSRIYKLEWSDGSPIIVIGSQGGLLQQPERRKYLTLAPAQRADVILDLGGRAIGSTLELRTAEYSASDVDSAEAGMGGMGGMRGMGRMGRTRVGAEQAVPNGAAQSLLSIRVTSRVAESFRLPDRLSTFDASWNRVPDGPVRQLAISFQAGQWGLSGRTFEMMETAPDEIVRAGSSQICEISNVSGMMGMPQAHPIHFHGKQFRVLGRRTVAGNGESRSVREGLLDEGWMDTVLVLPGESVRLQLHFSEYPGLYLYHCHILEHEDMGMMRNFKVVKA